MGRIKTKALDIIRHPLFSGSFLMIGGSMVVNVISYVYHVVMGRILGPVDYGTLASVFSIFYIVSIVPLSSSIAIVKFISTAKDKKEAAKIYRGINIFMIKLAIVLAVLILLISYPVSIFLHISNLVSVMLISPIVFVTLVTLVNQSAAQGLLKFMGVVGPNFISSLVKLLLGVLFVVLGLSVPGAMLAIFIGAVLSYFYSLYVVRQSIKNITVGAKFNLKPFLKYALPALLQAIAFTSIFTIDLILAKHFLSAFDAGLYAALSTSGKIIYFAATPIAGVMFPIVAKKHASGESSGKIFLISALATACLALCVDVIYYFFPGFAISVLFGREYLAASGYLILVGIFMTFYSINYFLVNYFLAFGKVKVVIIPIAAAIFQALSIYIFWHQNISQILIVGILSMTFVFIGLSSILVYTELAKRYAKT